MASIINTAGTTGMTGTNRKTDCTNSSAASNSLPFKGRARVTLPLPEGEGECCRDDIKMVALY